MIIKKYLEKEKEGKQQCQNCLEFGHWTYECTRPQTYVYRPSRTKLFKQNKFNLFNIKDQKEKIVPKQKKKKKKKKKKEIKVNHLVDPIHILVQEVEKVNHTHLGVVPNPIVVAIHHIQVVVQVLAGVIQIILKIKTKLFKTKKEKN